MTDTSISAYPTPPLAAPRPGFSIWAPGMRLMCHLHLRQKALLLLLCAWLPPLLLLALLYSAPKQSVDIAAFVDGRFAANLGSRWAPAGILAAVLVASLYLTACGWMAAFEGLKLLHRGALDMASGKPHVRTQGVGTDELGQALQALGAADDEMARLRAAAGQHAGVVSRTARELADAHLAMQLASLEARSAIGEIARRTVALCGMLDSDLQDAERANADLDAIQDEERHALQLMAALRAHLLALAHRCQTLGEGARAAAPQGDDAIGSIDDPIDTVSAEITQCHQLSERVGGAERMNERRIESMRLSTDRLMCRAERGMREAQQLMVLTRQIEATQAATLQRLEQMAACGAALGKLGQTQEAVTPAQAATHPAAAG